MFINPSNFYVYFIFESKFARSERYKLYVITAIGKLDRFEIESRKEEKK